MRTRAWVLLALVPGASAFWTFQVFGNGWPTFVECVSVSYAALAILARKEWL